MGKSGITILFFLFLGSTLASEDPGCRRLQGNKVCLVGDLSGWTVRTGTNFTAWAASMSLTVGDTLVFKYDNRYHDLLQVDQEAYRACDKSSPIANYTSGHDSIKFNSGGNYYFIDSHHCKYGQKVNIRITSHEHVVSKLSSGGGGSRSAPSSGSRGSSGGGRSSPSGRRSPSGGSSPSYSPPFFLWYFLWNDDSSASSLGGFNVVAVVISTMAVLLLS